MRIPRSVRDLQVGRESPLLDFSSQRLFHGLDLLFTQRREEFSFHAVVSDVMPCDHDGQGQVQVLMDDGLRSGQSMAPVSSLQLHDHVVKADRVIAIHGALVALREHQLQISVPAGHESGAALSCRNRKAAVELADVVIVQKLVGAFQGADLPQSELLR